MFTILFRGEFLTLEIDSYVDGRPALQSYDAEGLPYGRPTVNLPQYPLAADEVFVKTREWLMALIEAGVVADTGHTLPMGYGQAYVCRLLVVRE